MKPIYEILTAAQRGAALVAVDTYRGTDFMGWRAQSESALRTPGEVLHNSQALDRAHATAGAITGAAQVEADRIRGRIWQQIHQIQKELER